MTGRYLDNAMTREQYMALTDNELRQLRREEYGDNAPNPNDDDEDETAA